MSQMNKRLHDVSWNLNVTYKNGMKKEENGRNMIGLQKKYYLCGEIGNN